MGSKKHHGRNIKRVRETLGIKQEGLALEMGDDWNQRKISLLEQKEEIDDEILEQVASALKVPVEGIKNFNEDAAFNIIANNTHGHSASVNYYCTFNPIDKLVETLEEHKKLYERLLESEKEKVAILREQLEAKK